MEDKIYYTPQVSNATALRGAGLAVGTGVGLYELSKITPYLDKASIATQNGVAKVQNAINSLPNWIIPATLGGALVYTIFSGHNKNKKINTNRNYSFNGNINHRNNYRNNHKVQIYRNENNPSMINKLIGNSRPATIAAASVVPLILGLSMGHPVLGITTMVPSAALGDYLWAKNNKRNTKMEYSRNSYYNEKDNNRALQDSYRISYTFNRNAPARKAPIVKKYDPGVFGISDIGNMLVGAGTSFGVGLATGHPLIGLAGAIPATALGNYLYEIAHKTAREKIKSDRRNIR